MIKWHGLTGNAAITPNIVGSINVVSKEHTFSGSKEASVAFVERQPRERIWVNVVHAVDGAWGIGGVALVNTMLDAAIDKIAASGSRPVVHSDRGGHYRWPGWLSRIADAKLVRSMSSKGCSPDNAACEGFFGRLKIEMFFSRDGLSTTIDEFIASLDAYIQLYNEVRIKISLGARSPIWHRRSLGIAV